MSFLSDWLALPPGFLARERLSAVLNRCQEVVTLTHGLVGIMHAMMWLGQTVEVGGLLVLVLELHLV